MRDPARPSIPARPLCTHTGCTQFAVTYAHRAPLCARHAVAKVIDLKPEAFTKREAGQALAEYALIFLFVAAVVALVLTVFGPMIGGLLVPAVNAL